MSKPLPTFSFKTVLLGDSAVGKSSLVHRFCFKSFVTTLDPTVGAAYATQPCYLQSAIISYEIWDTAGAERYAALTPMYYRGAPSAIIVYDITCQKSFQRAQEWVGEIKNHCAPDCNVILIGNKADLAEHREVLVHDAQDFAASANILFCECSAKTGEHVEEAFEQLAKALHEKAISTGMAPKGEEGLEEEAIGKKAKAKGGKGGCC